MGAIHFSTDLALLQTLKRKLPLPIFFETGTFRGDTTASVAHLFQKVYTVELSSAVLSATATKLRHFENISMIQGSSPNVLGEFHEELRDQSVVYWLDAHWCDHKDAAGHDYECPLIPELEAIGSLNQHSVVLIDDARFFTAPPPLPHDASKWPTLCEVIVHLKKLSDTHKVWIINDVFVYAPTTVEKDIIGFSRSRGIDLLQLVRAAANANSKRTRK